MTDVRQTFDTMVRAAAVDLFRSFGLAVAPDEQRCLRADQMRKQSFYSQVKFDWGEFDGVFILELPGAIFDMMVRRRGDPNWDAQDCALESNNQLFGRVRARLARRGISVRAQPPSAVSFREVRELDRAHRFFATYAFKTLRSDFQIVVAGDIDLKLLNDSSQLDIPNEGSIVLF